MWKLLVLLAAAGQATAQNVTATGSFAFTPTPVTTSIPSATGSLNESVPGQGMYPPLQVLCNAGSADTFCPGGLLQDVQLSLIFPDSKTFVDKPTNGTLNDTLAAYDALGANKTVGDIIEFVERYFKGEGLELSQVQIEGFNPNPAILDNVQDPLIKGWVSVVHQYWTLLIRETNDTAVCSGPEDCESSLIPLNNTIVVPGGRYREIYYWDSYWILEGLLKSELYNYANDLLQNFMDLIDLYGFLPNGGRKYYLNRSQPPVFVQMVHEYVRYTGNTTILERALSIADAEMEWWRVNRTISVTSPFTNKTYDVAHYNVTNSAPRPEGYVEDYTAVMEASPPLNSSAAADLYAELATGAESGWDYSVRWCKEPIINLDDNNVILRTLNVRSIIPVDLNSLLAGDHALLADMYELYANSSSGSNGTLSNSTSAASNSSDRIAYHREVAQNFTDAVLDLNWDPAKSWFYDFNLTSNDRTDFYSPAGTFALWQNITPPEVQGNETAALEVASGLRFLLGKYSGLPSVASLYATGLNWDFPNAWPPHAYTAIKAIEHLGYAVGNNATVLSNLTIPFGDVAAGQLGLNETDLQEQPQSLIGNVSLYTDVAKDQPWPLALQIEIANRYTQAAFCSWYSTGGEIDGLLTQLPLNDLNATGTYGGGFGVMFEKFNATDTDAAGGGGEYEVVVLWIAGEYGQYLPTPTCPLIPIIETGANATGSGGNATAPGNSTSLFSAGRTYQGYRIPRD